MPQAELSDVVKAGRLRATTDMAELGDDGRHRHLRADAAPQDQGPGSVVRRAGRRSRGRARSSRASSSSSSRRPIPARPTKSCSRCSRAGGLKADVDFFLAFSPERVDPGNQKFNTRNIPKVVGGIGPASTEAAAPLYGSTVDTVVPVSSTRVAEMVKLLENTFRAVNIGLVNEIALMCHKMDIDVWEVIDAAKTKPFGFMPFYPGPGLGGHCIPIDPFYLSWKARQNGFECRFIELAGRSTRSMPEYVVERVAEALNTARKPINGSRVHLFGVAYKQDVNDMRESPALDVLELLSKRGAAVELHRSVRARAQARRPRAVVDRSRGGARGGARLRRDLHRPHRVRLRRARSRAARWSSTRATRSRITSRRESSASEDRLHSRHARLAAGSARSALSVVARCASTRRIVKATTSSRARCPARRGNVIPSSTACRVSSSTN